MSCRVSILLAGFMLATSMGAAAAAKPKHVFIIVLENEGYHFTFGRKSPAVYLNGLAKQGALLQNYYGIGHFSLDNYIAMVSGQPPNPVTQSDCQSFIDFERSGMTAEGAAVGAGCVYPNDVKTIADQLEAKGLTWRAYMEDMGNIPSREAATCGHPTIGSSDGTQAAVLGDQYATRHNPFVYFHSIIDRPTCDKNVVPLPNLLLDLQSVSTTPNFVFVAPNLCHDGHDGGENGRICIDGQPGGLVSADKFLANMVPAILASPAFNKDGLLIVTFDEADIDVKFDSATNTAEMKGGDASACCNELPGPNLGPNSLVFGMKNKGAGVTGPGGGRIGAVLVSPMIKPGTVSRAHYNHYALLRSIENMFDLEHLGYAARPGLRSFGADVFTQRSRRQ